MKGRPRVKRPIPQPKLDVTRPASSEVTSRQMTKEEHERLGEAVPRTRDFIHWERPTPKERERKRD